MSLSQKHSGKVLVPWFNVAEWKAVYNLVYTEGSENWPKALEILHIWKLRTPLLSAGVEGTLILLEALLADKSKLTSYEITHIFSTALVRFLNLCAAKSDKQGTFYKTAKENELPNWLISIRHDIAHSHNVPSQGMLELSLKFCLSWLKDKYWEVQQEQMTDFVVKEDEVKYLESTFFTYVHLISKAQDEELQRYSNEFSQNKKKLSRTELVNCIAGKLKEIIQCNPQEASDKLFVYLLSKNGILAQEDEFDTFELENIPKTTLSKWNKLLDTIHDMELTPNFVHKLFNFICDKTQELTDREVASIWVKEIYKGLKNLENNTEDENSLQFSSKNNCMKDRKFVFEIVKKLTPFTLNFVKEVLEYNNAPDQFIEDSINLISAFNTSKFTDSRNILTVDDLNFNIEDTTENEISNINETTAEARWVLIEDTSPYKYLPLGVLPHQLRTINPILNL